MDNHEFMSIYLQEQMELNNEWYNLQKQLIYLENKAIIEKLPETIITGVYTYLYGVEEFFDRMYNIVKREWNYFSIYYKKTNKEIKTYVKKNESLLKANSLDLNFYGFNYELDKKLTIKYTDLSPTDKQPVLTIDVMNKLTKQKNKKMKTQDITTSNFNDIRGKILGGTSISQEDFRREVEEFYKCGTVRTLININSLSDVDMSQSNTLKSISTVKKEIDLFYTNVLDFLHACKTVIDLDTKDHIIGKNLKVNKKLINEYMLIKTMEFREFAQIYNTLLLTLLSCTRDKLEQDKEIMTLL